MYEQERQAIIDYARSQIGAAKADHPRVQAYWADCLKGGLPPKGYVKSWCGGFVLHCLRTVLGIEDQWRDGRGFIYQSITKGKTVKTPQVGDIVHYPTRHQHYALVADVRPDGLVTIDGNSLHSSAGTGVWEHTKTWALLKAQGAVYFTIEPFLQDQAKTNPMNPRIVDEH